jgi:hypothetical protein
MGVVALPWQNFCYCNDAKNGVTQANLLLAVTVVLTLSHE